MNKLIQTIAVKKYCLYIRYEYFIACMFFIQQFVVMTPEILIPYYYYYSNSHGKFVTWFPHSKHQAVAYIALGPVHTETFSCVFVLFQVMGWLFSIPLRTVNKTKTQENVSVCTGPQVSSIFLKILAVPNKQAFWIN